MHAIATLSQQLHRAATCTGPPGLALHVHVALQATADLLVSGQLCAKSSGRVRLACQAWLEWVLIDTSSHRRHGLGHHSEPLALSWQRSERYVRFASESTAHISRSAGPFLIAALHAGAVSAGSSGPCVLTHGSSASVTALLLHAARSAHFTLVVAEGKAEGEGHRTAAALMQAGVPVRMIEPCAIAHCMGQVQLVLCGARAVRQDGGVIGDLGTQTMAIVAQAHKRPCYVAAPHFLFCRTHELHPDAGCGSSAEWGLPWELGLPAAPPPVTRDNSERAATPPLREVQHAPPASYDISCDATPPHLISLLFTDLGILTPSAISDELLEREQWTCAAGGPSRPWTSPRISPGPRGSAEALSGLATLTL